MAPRRAAYSGPRVSSALARTLTSRTIFVSRRRPLGAHHSGRYQTRISWREQAWYAWAPDKGPRRITYRPTGPAFERSGTAVHFSEVRPAIDVDFGSGHVAVGAA